MNQLLPYELELKQQWLDLPLPDENMAWADMRRRLDEEDKRRVIPFWLTGCAGWGLLGILLLGLGWWIVRPEKWFNNKQQPATEQTTNADQINKTGNDTVFESKDSNSTKAFTRNGSLLNIPGADSPQAKQTTDPVKADKNLTTVDNKSDFATNVQNGSKKKSKPTVKNGNKPVKEKDRLSSDVKPPVVKSDKDNKPQIKKDDQAAASVVVDTIDKRPVTQPTLSIDSPGVSKPIVIDTAVVKTKTDTVAKKPDEIAENKRSKKDSTKKSPLVFSAGIGLYQQLPLDSQKLSPYSSSGRKTSLADYIPSVYFRVTKPGKWFLQSEFRYGAPQQTKELKFRQYATSDTNSQGVRFTSTNAFILKKTFYHQLPLSFNYYVLPNWSVGAGMQWNNFHSAVAEREFTRRNDFTQVIDSTSKSIEPLKKDSAYEFKKSYWQAIIQTQYQWRRFTFGARYNFGLQPYISFTLPGQPLREEKNSSLQVFILFELWKSQKIKNKE